MQNNNSTEHDQAAAAAALVRQQLRQRAVQARETLDLGTRQRLQAEIDRHLQILLEQLAPQQLGFCWPYRAEPDVRELVARWLMADPADPADPQRQAALPVVEDRQRALKFRQWTPETVLRAGAYGIPEPVGTAVLQPQVLLIPLNAFDAAGYRLGYGGGYFDRTLAELPVQAVGVGFELGRVDSCLPQAHDRPMDWIVTEAGCWPAGDTQLARNSR